MKLTNKDPKIKKIFEEKMRENGADAYRVFIEFAYAHNKDFFEYINGVCSGELEPYFSQE